MLQRLVLCLALIFILAETAFNLYTEFSLQHSAKTVQFDSVAKPSFTIVLIPLDSRPPCIQFVEKLAALANISILTPPLELLDNYQTPAKIVELRTWLRQALQGANAAIISTDMLIHGGLIASRSSRGTQKDIADTLTLLEECHQANPSVELYVFNIIPRLLTADSNANAPYQLDMQKYSVLKDKVLTFENPNDIAELKLLEKSIPIDVIDNYLKRNQKSAEVSIELIKMTEKGIISGLIIGQDDCQPFGLPNIIKRQLEYFVDKHSNLSGKVYITRGTDEVALTLLGRIVTKLTNHKPQIFVQYSDADTAKIIMPYMPHSVAKTVEEKIGIIGGKQTFDRDKADFILFVHIGTAQTSSALLANATQQVKHLLDSNHKVALVDLSNRFDGRDTLLPLLINKDAPIIRLAAYAGWNTTSNSIGSALTEGTLFTQALHVNTSSPHVLAVYKNNIEFLTARFLDDWFYEKDIQPYIAAILQRLNVDKNNLDSKYYSVNRLVQTLLSGRAYRLYHQSLYSHPILIESGERILISNFHINACLPWSRIFEIRISPTVSIATIGEHN